MRNSLISAATDIFREPAPEATQPHAPSRLCAYIEAAGACGLLVIVGLTLLTSWR